MLSTALEILEATNSSLYDEEIMNLAAELHARRNELPDEMYAKYIFMYSAALASRVADKVALACLSKEDYNLMTDVVSEMDDLTDDILREDRENGQ